MSAHARLRELHELIDALVMRPAAGALVLACTDREMLYIFHTLDQLDAESPADRFLVGGQAFIDADQYTASIVSQIAAATARPVPDIRAPAARLRAALTTLLSDLPLGDHRLVAALVPVRIEDAAGFAALVEPLLAEPLPAALRLVIREHNDAPTLFDVAGASASTSLLAYRFELPADLVVESVRDRARDPSLSPSERANAVLELAARDLSHGRYQEAITVCDVVLTEETDPLTAALALALRADAQHKTGELLAALASGGAALRTAVACQALPIVHQAAMTLGEVSQALGNLDDATRCFDIAEQSAPHSQEAQALARQRRLALRTDPPC